jgi:hypothetical protein
MLRWLVPLVATVLGLPACATDPMRLPPPCSQVGAHDGLAVEIDVTGGKLPPDFWTIVVGADGQQRTLSFAIQTGDPVAPRDRVDEAAAAGKALLVDGWLTATAGGVTIGYAEEGAGGPAQISIDVADSGGVVGHADFTPSYQLFEPNGPDCPPHVYTAGATMTITAPAAP